MEREAYIFLTLIGGNTCRSIIRSALQEYGNPQADIYHLNQSPDYLPVLLQNLRVVIRGLGRVGASADLATLNEIRSKSEAFMGLGKGSKHKDAITNIMQWIEKSRDSIIHRGS